MSELHAHSLPPVRNVRRKRILIVEDESLVALMMADHLAELGYAVVGPASTISEARHLASVASIDAALIDLKLHGVLADEIADILSLRQVPFNLVTGYSVPPPAPYKNAKILHKPFQLNDLREAVERMLAKPSAEGQGTVAQKAAS